MQCCVPFPKGGRLQNLSALAAATLRCADQPTHYVASRRYHSCHPLPSPRHQRYTALPVAPFQFSRRYLNTDVAVDVDATINSFPSFAFVFDIDGVLLRSSKPLPGAVEALLYLQKNRIPFILLTNGGGSLEHERVQQLSQQLGVPLSEDMLVQSHTPFKDLVDGRPDLPQGPLRDKVILAIGGDGDKCRKVAKSYGFTKVVTTGDIVMDCPSIWPFSKLFSHSYEASCQPLPSPIDPANPANSLKIDAILVFNDPRDWALDMQIIMDLTLSKDGILSTTSEKNGDTSLPNLGYQQDGQPKIYFSNPDLIWAAEYHMPRLGQGSFRAALIGAFSRTTRARLGSVVIGKPHHITYRYAEATLRKNREKLMLALDDSRSRVSSNMLSRVFMVGDNPASDIRGANNYAGQQKVPWTSILVKTGVYQEGTKPEYEPKATVDNVLEAVKWALKKEGWEYQSD